MSEEFVNEMKKINRDRKKPLTINIKITDVPMSLFKEFIHDIDKYNGCYAWKFADMMRMCQAYQAFAAYGLIQQEQEETPLETEESKQEVKTFGGVIKDGKIQ